MHGKLSLWYAWEKIKIKVLLKQLKKHSFNWYDEIENETDLFWININDKLIEYVKCQDILLLFTFVKYFVNNWMFVNSELDENDSHKERNLLGENNFVGLKATSLPQKVSFKSCCVTYTTFIFVPEKTFL